MVPVSTSGVKAAPPHTHEACRCCHTAPMDLDSWTPDDNARRLATVIATAAGMFAFVALWLGADFYVLLALLAGAGLGVVVWFIARRLLLVWFRR